MPQSLLALLAILSISVLVLQDSRDRISDLTESYRNEAEVQSRGMAVEVLERLSGLPFDGGEGADPAGTGTALYSPEGSFGTDAETEGQPLGTFFSSATHDDLDDFDGLLHTVADVVVFDPTSGTQETLSLDVSIAVVYMERTGADWVRSAGGARTPFKQATVAVDHPAFNGPARLARIYVAD